MTDRQKELLNSLGDVLENLADECENDNDFHELIIKNNHLFPASLTDMAAEVKDSID
ncbi:hypothetical protein [Oceanobacillus oncorhynchi]|uniref:hypothetical protein n=1 Tax=Oceanobacillus oncorhynchi TaxID=545501 RepID=UPI0034D5C031